MNYITAEEARHIGKVSRNNYDLIKEYIYKNIENAAQEQCDGINVEFDINFINKYDFDQQIKSVQNELKNDGYTTSYLCYPNGRKLRIHWGNAYVDKEINTIETPMEAIVNEE